MSSKARFARVVFMLIFAVSIFSFVSFAHTSPVLALSNSSPVHVNHSPFKVLPSDTFNIINQKSGLCIGIAPGQNFAGDWACNSNNDQLWHAGGCNQNGFCQLINQNNACLGVSGGSTQAGARIVGWSCNGNGDQYWATFNCTTYEYLLNYKSRLVIGVLNGSTQNGAELIQWQYNGNRDQCWFLG